MVYKSPPYLPITDHFDSNLSFSAEDMELLNSLGQNVIRLGVMWPGVEPQRGEYNMTYINNAATLINTAYNDYNISTLVDCHQDVLSEAFCGEGAPLWAMEPLLWNFPEPLSSSYKTANDHIPSQADCLKKNWPSYYAAQATSSAFQRLYDNHNGLRDSFADYWGKLAKEFMDIPGIIGFELMNEPWAGGIYDDPFLMYPGTADRKNLEPFYDAIQPKIYGNDSERMIFFESVTWTDEWNISLDAIGFDHVPGGHEFANTSVFSFHYYSSPNVGDKHKYFSARSIDGKRLGATSFLTEFDVNSDIDTPGMFADTANVCDEYLISWIGWEYKTMAGALSDGTCTGCGYGLWKPDGTLDEQIAKSVSRTYAQKVAGRTLMQHFDSKQGGIFTLVFAMNTDIEAPTIIFTNLKYWYPKGFKMEVDPKDAVRASTNGQFVELYNRRESGYHMQSVNVTIQPQK